MYKVSRVLWLWLIVGLQPAFAAGAKLEANPYFADVDALTSYFNESSDLGGAPDELLVEPRPNGIWRLQFQAMNREHGDDGATYSETIAVLMDYSYVENKIIGGSGRMAGIVFCKDFAYPDRTKPSCYGLPKVPREQVAKATVAARYFVGEEVPRVLTDAHKKALADYRAGRKADAAKKAETLIGAAPWKVVPIAADNVESYNDLGFFLAEGGKYKEAVQVLEEVTRAVPDRTAAYLNLGDAYLGLSDTPRAKTAYKQYQKLMQQSGNGAKIPKRIQKVLDKG